MKAHDWTKGVHSASKQPAFDAQLYKCTPTNVWMCNLIIHVQGKDRRRPNAAWQKHERSSNGIAWLIRDQCCPYPHTSRLGLSRLHWSLFRHRWKLEQSHVGMLKGHLSVAGLYKNTLSDKLEENPPLIKLDLSPGAPLHHDNVLHLFILQHFLSDTLDRVHAFLRM